jgi:hypothetical protein
LPEHSLELDLLGSRITIRTNDDEWNDFLAEQWGLFATTDHSPGAIAEITRDGTGLWLELPGQAPLPFEDEWTLAEVLRYYLAEHAVKDIRGAVPLHAGAVVGPEGAALLLGESGAGKTTLTLALAREGWSLGSDDIAPLDLASGLVRPFPKPLGIRDPAVARGLEDEGWRPRWPAPETGPVLVPPGLFRTEGSPFPVTWLFYIAYDPRSPAYLEVISPARSAAKSVDYARDISPAAVSALARLARGARSVIISYRSTEEALEMITRASNSPTPPQT